MQSEPVDENEVMGLWRRHAPAKYPEGVLEVPAAIRGTAFFPGGYGLWGAEAGRSLPDFPFRGVMVLGHDFHSEVGYRASVKAGRESVKQPTWRNLIRLLTCADIPLDRCFFTNYYMGLRAGAASTGRFPGADDESFVRHCQSFLIDQLRTQRPRLLITLGVHVPFAISSLSPYLDDWGLRRGFRHLDAVGPMRDGVRFRGIPDFAMTIVALIHPSQRQASLHHRRYAQTTGDAAELAMLRRARLEVDHV
jgi:hypothetical protein